MRRCRSLATAFTAVVLAASGLTGCGPGDPRISADRALYPVFQRAVTDYVNRCDPARPTRLAVDAPSGTTVAVDGAAARAGAFEVQVPQAEGQRFEIVVTDADSTTIHHVRCLPVDFPTWHADRRAEIQTQFYAVTIVQGFGRPGSYSVLFDKHGVPIWWLERRPTFLLTPLPTGNFGIVEHGPEAAMHEIDVNGRVVRTLETPGGPVDFHDVIVLPNGNYVLATAQNEPCDLSSWDLGVTTCINHVFHELTPEGESVWSWDTAEHIPVTETTDPWRAAEKHSETGPFPTPDLWDPWHYNSVEFTGDGFIISLRHTDAVYKLDRDSGDIEWKLGGTSRPESLTILDDPRRGVGGQHDARQLPDGSISIYDNGSRPLDPPLQPRRVVYRINEQARTATLVEDLRDRFQAFVDCCGSTRLLPGGNSVTGWGGSNTVSEHQAGGRRIYTLEIQGMVYRGVPVPPGHHEVEELRAGMDAMHGG